MLFMFVFLATRTEELKRKSGGIAFLLFAFVFMGLTLPLPSVAASADDPQLPALRGNQDYDSVVRAYVQGTVPKVIGGAVAPTGAYPWQVSLDVAYITDPARAHYCGGAIINESWLVTAAHCLERLDIGDIGVTFGTNILGSSGQHAVVEKIIVPKGFDPVTKDNDIGLVRIKTTFSGARVHPIQLLRPDEAPRIFQPDRPLMVTGWGATIENGDNVLLLRQVAVPYVPANVCKDPLSYGSRITDTMICAGKAAGGVDACQGDSGGPLVFLGATADSSRQVGIVSWGIGCAEPGKYGVYTRIDTYVDWIAACVTNPKSCQ